MAVTPPTLGDYCFYNVPTTIPVHVPCESKTAYNTATGWSNFSNYVGIGQPDTTFINAEITTGETYTDNGFNESSAGTYTQTLQSVNGCDSIVVLNLSVTNSLNAIATTNFGIYPNPTSSQLKIKNYQLKDGETVEIIDVLGRVQQSSIVNHQSEIIIDVSHLPQGMYFIKIGNWRGKFVVN